MIYQTLKNQGYSDDNILLMLPENTACNPRNIYPGIQTPFPNQKGSNLYRDIEIDYKSIDVTVKGITNIFRGKYDKYTPFSQRVKLNKDTNLLVYFAGHGGDSYIKMQDTAVLFDEDLARSIDESYLKKLYKETAMFSDSCSAATLFYKLTAPDIIATGSSTFDQKSLSHDFDSNLQIYKQSQFSFQTYKYFNDIENNVQEQKFSDLHKNYERKYMSSNVETINTMPNKTLDDLFLKDFWSIDQNKKPLLYNITQQFNNQTIPNSQYSQIQNLNNQLLQQTAPSNKIKII